MLRLLITAGPTREPIDAVRFVSNRSSGALERAIARAAVDGGHAVTLLLGPGPRADEVPAPTASAGPTGGCRVIRFETTADLERLLDEQFSEHDVLIMAAAVADYRPARPVEGKLPRDPGKPLVLELEPTPDLVGRLAGRKQDGQRIIAFALEEPERLEVRAAEKMRRKGVDAIVANPLTTMESGRVAAVWLTADGRREAPGEMSKEDFAAWLVGRVAS